MADETLLVERRSQVAYVTLNRPDALNALNTALRQELKLFSPRWNMTQMFVWWSSPAPVEPFVPARISRSGRNPARWLTIGKTGSASIFGAP